jgi:lysophospholipase L1-like esterase
MKKIDLTYIKAGALSLSGEVVEKADWLITDFIPVDVNFPAIEYFLFAEKDVLSLAFYDQQKSFLRGVTAEGESFLENTVNDNMRVPGCATFFRVCAPKAFSKSAVVFTNTLPQVNPSEKVVAVACIGDSLTEGDYGGVPCVANVQPYNYPYFMKKCFRVLTRNYGRCGNTSSDINAWFDSGEIVLKEANITLIMLGTNQGLSLGSDKHLCAYKQLICKIKKTEPQTKIVLVTPPRATINPKQVNFGYAGNVENAVKEVILLAKSENLPLIDLYHSGVFTEENEDVVQPRDGLHFGYLGYKKLALFLGEELQKLFPSVFF